MHAPLRIVAPGSSRRHNAATAWRPCQPPLLLHYCPSASCSAPGAPLVLMCGSMGCVGGPMPLIAAGCGTKGGRPGLTRGPAGPAMPGGMAMGMPAAPGGGMGMAPGGSGPPGGRGGPSGSVLLALILVMAMLRSCCSVAITLPCRGGGCSGGCQVIGSTDRLCLPSARCCQCMPRGFSCHPAVTWLVTHRADSCLQHAALLCTAQPCCHLM
jgi:hypothetical protein